MLVEALDQTGLVEGSSWRVYATPVDIEDERRRQKKFQYAEADLYICPDT